MFEKNLISIDLGTSKTKIVVGKQVGATVTVDKAISYSTPADAVSDGKINNIPIIIDTLDKVLEQNKIKHKDAVLTVESTSIITRELVLPTANKDEMDTMIKFEIEQYLPIMLSEYVVEYKLIEEFEEDSTKKSRILVAALPKSMAENYLELLKLLKMNPVALDKNSNALSKLFASRPKLNDENTSLDKTVAIIDIGFSSINVNIISNGLLRFNRLILQGGRNIDINIANTFNLSLQEAEIKKMEDCDISRDSSSDSSIDILNNTVKGTVYSWLSDIDRLFQYYTSRNTGNRVDTIYLYGGGSNIKGICDYISSNMNTPVYKLSCMSNVKINKNIENFNMEYFLNAVSAIIRRQ